MADGSDHHSDHHRRSRFWTSSCSHFGFGTRWRGTLPRGRRRTSGAPRNRHRCRTWRRVYYRKVKGAVIERVGRVRNNVLEGRAKSVSGVFEGIHFLGTDFTVKATAHFTRPLLVCDQTARLSKLATAVLYARLKSRRQDLVCKTLSWSLGT
jgi:hypothetical protein